MPTRLALFMLLSVLPISAGLAGCAPLQKSSGSIERLEEHTEVIELRLASVEERLTLVEQEVGVLRSQGGLPEGARRVDPGPSLAKFPEFAAERPKHPGVIVEASPQSADRLRPVDEAARPSPAQGISQPVGQHHVVSNETAPNKAVPNNVVQGKAVQNKAVRDKTVRGKTVQDEATPDKAVQASATQGTNSEGTARQAPVLIPPKGATGGQMANPYAPLQPAMGLGGTLPAGEGTAGKGTGLKTLSRRAGGGVSSLPAGLRGLPSGFRTGVRSYDEALAMYYRHEYARSHKAFTAFIEGNKGHRLLPNALYWQGESAYSQGEHVSAILSFKTITSQYPKHPKAADALLKIGMSYERLKDSANAQFYWQVLVDDFPKSSAARVARKHMRR